MQLHRVHRIIYYIASTMKTGVDLDVNQMDLLLSELVLGMKVNTFLKYGQMVVSHLMTNL